MNKNKKLGFTLAEVLIVIGIIGVVAALTLPNLNHATGDKEKVTKVKKIYSALTEAVDRAQVIYGPFDTWLNNVSFDDNLDLVALNAKFGKRITEFMKVSKDCGNEEGCFSTASLLNADGTIYYNAQNYLQSLQDCPSYMVTLSDGTSLAFRSGGIAWNISVDIDGPNKGKNMIGNDIFEFTIGYYNEECTEYGYCRLNQVSALRYSGEDDIYLYTTAWVIENGNLDYLKCIEKLNWETKTSCE